MNNNKEFSKYIVRIPIELHKKAKVYAANKRISLEKALIEAIDAKFGK